MDRGASAGSMDRGASGASASQRGSVSASPRDSYGGGGGSAASREHERNAQQFRVRLRGSGAQTRDASSRGQLEHEQFARELLGRVAWWRRRRWRRWRRRTRRRGPAMITANAMNPATDRTGSAAMTDIIDKASGCVARLSLGLASVAFAIGVRLGGRGADAARRSRPRTRPRARWCRRCKAARSPRRLAVLGPVPTRWLAPVIAVADRAANEAIRRCVRWRSTRSSPTATTRAKLHDRRPTTGRSPFPLVQGGRRLALRHGGGQGGDARAAHRRQRARRHRRACSRSSTRSASTHRPTAIATARSSTRGSSPAAPGKQRRTLLADEGGRTGEPARTARRARNRAKGTRRRRKDRRPYHGYHFRMLKGQGPAASGGALDYVVRGG